MAAIASSAIGDALRFGSQHMTAPPRTAVGFVAAIIHRAVADIAAGWAPLCASQGLWLEIDGVFCHAAPMVRYTDTAGQQRRCELADLLIAVDTVSSGAWVRRAALIQAKMAARSARVVMSGPSTRNQLELYQQWPFFDFEEAAYGLKQVNFRKGNNTAHSGTFGVIDRHLIEPATDPPIWTQHSAWPTPHDTSHGVTLGVFLAGIVDGRRGFGRECTPPLGTDWSKTVECLLEITFRRSFRHRPTLGNRAMQRGVHAPASLALRTAQGPVGQFWVGSGAPPSFRGEEVSREPDRPLGINALYIKLQYTDAAG
jgi:hypothetical protein